MINAQSETWQEIKQWAQCERDEYLRLLVIENNDEYRGRIKMLDDLLELNNRPLIEPPHGG